jgi:hypothetical protein
MAAPIENTAGKTPCTKPAEKALPVTTTVIEEKRRREKSTERVISNSLFQKLVEDNLRMQSIVAEYDPMQTLDSRVTDSLFGLQGFTMG